MGLDVGRRLTPAGNIDVGFLTIVYLRYRSLPRRLPRGG